MRIRSSVGHLGKEHIVHYGPTQNMRLPACILQSVEWEEDMVQTFWELSAQGRRQELYVWDKVEDNLGQCYVLKSLTGEMGSLEEKLIIIALGDSPVTGTLKPCRGFCPIFNFIINRLSTFVRGDKGRSSEESSGDSAGPTRVGTSEASLL